MRVDVLDAEERVEDAVRLVELDEAAVGQHAPHLRLEVVPLLRAVEVLEDGEAALLQVGAERFRFRLGEHSRSRAPT